MCGLVATIRHVVSIPQAQAGRGPGTGGQQALLRIIARHPVPAFMVMGLGAGFLTAAIRPIAEAEGLPFGPTAARILGSCSESVSAHSWLPERSLGAKALLILLGAGCAGASRCAGTWSHVHRSGRRDADLTRYLRLSSARLAPQRLASRARRGRHRLSAAAGALERSASLGFLQHHWQDCYHPMKLTCMWALWHVPDHFAEEGWGVEALISAPVIFAIECVSLFFARALFVWFYNRTGYSVLLVAIFHASFDAAISQLSYDVVPASNTARFLIFSGVIALFATAVIIATKGQRTSQRGLVAVGAPAHLLGFGIAQLVSTAAWPIAILGSVSLGAGLAWPGYRLWHAPAGSDLLAANRSAQV
jgi:hypothetical protein